MHGVPVFLYGFVMALLLLCEAVGDTLDLQSTRRGARS